MGFLWVMFFCLGGLFGVEIECQDFCFSWDWFQEEVVVVFGWGFCDMFVWFRCLILVSVRVQVFIRLWCVLVGFYYCWFYGQVSDINRVVVLLFGVLELVRVQQVVVWVIWLWLCLLLCFGVYFLVLICWWCFVCMLSYVCGICLVWLVWWWVKLIVLLSFNICIVRVLILVRVVLCFSMMCWVVLMLV